MVITPYKSLFVENRGASSVLSVFDLVAPLVRLIPCSNTLLNKIGNNCFDRISNSLKVGKNNLFPGYVTENSIGKGHIICPNRSINKSSRARTDRQTDGHYYRYLVGPTRPSGFRLRENQEVTGFNKRRVSNKRRANFLKAKFPIDASAFIGTFTVVR